MIGRVEGIKSELQRVALVKAEILTHRQIHLPRSRFKEGPLAEIADLIGQGRIEGIERLDIPEVARCPIVRDRADPCRIRTVGAAVVVEGGAITDGTGEYGRPVGERENTAKLPAADDLVCHATHVRQRLALSKRQFVQRRRPPTAAPR